jgi:hypothetical protein
MASRTLEELAQEIATLRRQVQAAAKTADVLQGESDPGVVATGPLRFKGGAVYSVAMDPSTGGAAVDVRAVRTFAVEFVFGTAQATFS